MNLKAKFFSVLQEAINANADRLLDGKCPDMETYARACGIIYGLKMAMDEFDTVLSDSMKIKEEMGEVE